MKEYNFVIWNTHPMYQDKINTFLEEAKNIIGLNLSQIPESVKIEEIPKYIESLGNIHALIHRNEHGVMHISAEWIDIIKYCHSKKISVLSFDFGYFDHYSNFMVDYYYNRDGVSGIYKEWNDLSTDFSWDTAPTYLIEYRNKILEDVEAEKNSKLPFDLHKKNPIIIWGQWTTDLIRTCFYENKRPIKMDHWMTKVAEKVKEAGFTPIIKMSPVKSIEPYKKLQSENYIFVGRKKHMEELPLTLYTKNVNAKLIAHGKAHIINCSSVSNELLLCGCKIIAMGRSWFDNLGIFYEPKNWEELMNYQEQNPINTNKWINWWISRQCLKNKICEKFIEIYEKSQLNTQWI